MLALSLTLRQVVMCSVHTFYTSGFIVGAPRAFCEGTDSRTSTTHIVWNE